MKKIFFFILFTCIATFSQNQKSELNFKSDLILETKMSSRAIYIDNERVWIGMDKGRYGFYDKKKDTTIINEIQSVSRTTEFRSIAGTKEAVFILAVGNPAMLIRIDKKTLKETIVYKEENEKIFFDSMHFVDDANGFAMGDPTTDCLSFIKTIDGGNTWQKINCDVLPKVIEGEAAFAASNTNLILRGKSIFMVSGGKQSRIFVSNDFGSTWNVYPTPIIQGATMTGIFTADFYDSKNGIIAGGDYEKQDQNWSNKATTNDGGKTWKLVGEKQGSGYTSCVKYVPNSKGKKIIAVGGTGMFYSKDKGKTWTKFSNETNFYAIQFESEKVFYATGKNQLVQFEL
jgi:photosystem II stability/assembly factor-like uncharacterized protein